MKNIEIEILGCGSSSGVPAIGNYWGNCNPNNPKNRRLRSSILIKSKKTSLIIDATNDETKFELKVAKIRGVESYGMLCSEQMSALQ